MSKTIMLIHGAWVTTDCWNSFRDFFEAKGTVSSFRRGHTSTGRGRVASKSRSAPRKDDDQGIGRYYREANSESCRHSLSSSDIPLAD